MSRRRVSFEALETRVSWRRALSVIGGGAMLVSLVGAVLITVLLTPAVPPALASIPAPAVEEATPEADLTEAEEEVDIVRTTESIHASQPGDSIPISYRSPRIMEAGTVRIQLTGVSVAGEEVEQGQQVFRFDLVDALTRETIGTVDLTRQDGIDSPTAVLATLTESRATYLRVSAEVRAESTCHGCDPSSVHSQQAVWHTWHASIQYDKAE